MLRRLLVEVEPDRTADAGPAQAAVAAWVFGQVLLVIVLGVIEGVERRNLSRDFAMAGRAQLLLVRRERATRDILLLVIDRVDG